MNKLYLYKIRTKKNIGEIYNLFHQHEKTNSKFQFSIEAFHKEILEIRSSEKIKSKIRVISSEGDITYLEYETYQNILFSLFEIKDSFYMVLHNPPRSTRSFFNLFSSLMGIGYSIEELNLNLLKLSCYFIDHHHCSIKHIEVEKISLNHKSFANVEIYSSDDALKDFNQFIHKENIQLNKVTIEIKNLFSDFTFTLLKRGVIHIGNYDPSNSLSGNEIFKYIREIINIKE